jgi:hypothetical protein
MTFCLLRVLGNAVGLLLVELIQEPSRGVVLSDV